MISVKGVVLAYRQGRVHLLQALVRMMRARETIDEMTGYREPPVPYMPLDADTEMEIALKQPFTAHELAMRRGRHDLRLWAKVKGSPYERAYRRHFNYTGL